MNCQARRDGLALEGGPPVRRDPLPIWPNYGQAELEVAQRILLSGKLNYWAGGSETDEHTGPGACASRTGCPARR
jgi:hypothetical protein